MGSTHRLLELAVASLALLALGGVGASSAMAEEPNNPCGGKPIKGQGSSLQLIAQETVWKHGFETFVCPMGPTITYTGSGSAAGLKAFGVEKLESPKISKDAFIGTDDAPNEAQLMEMEEEAKGKFKVAGEAQDLVIPVAQAAIAIIVHPPTECLITQIRNHDLQEVWNGKFLNWSEIETTTADKAGACTHPITRVTRQDGSGTTYQFKHYLFEINKALLPGTIKGIHTLERDWEELQPETEANLEWPEGTTLSPVEKPANKGGGEEVALVKADEGTIGYANLGDARGSFTVGTLEWVSVQTNGIKTLAEEGVEKPTFLAPGTSATEPSITAANANCAETEYTPLPANPQEPDQDWSKVYGGKPDAAAGKGHYPICTLTWDVALVNYTKAEVEEVGSLPSEIGQTAFDYLNYVISKEPTGGQPEIENNHDYLGLTTPLQEDAEGLTEKIAGGVLARHRVLSTTLELKFAAVKTTHPAEFTNDGPEEWKSANAKIVGKVPGSYKIVTDTCSGKKIAVLGKCTVEVEYVVGVQNEAVLALAPGPSVKLN